MADNKKPPKLNYHQADRLKRVGLKDLILHNLADNNGVGKSIKYAVSDKLKGRVTRLKRHFDPLNLVRGLTGNLGAAIVGRWLGRSAEDIRYFGGIRGHAAIHHYNRPIRDIPERVERDIPPEPQRSAGQSQRLPRNNSDITNSLEKTYALLQKHFDLETTHFNATKSDNEIREKERDKWNADLLKALAGKGFNPIIKSTEKEDHKGIFGTIIGIIEGIAGLITGFIKTIGSTLAKILEYTMKFVGWISELNWLKGIGSLKNLISLLATPTAGAIAGVAAIGLGANVLINHQNSKIEDKMMRLGGPEASRLAFSQVKKNTQSNLKDDIGFGNAQAEELAGNKKKLAALTTQKQDLMETEMKSRGYTKSGTDKDGAYQFVDKDKKPVTDKIYNDASAKINDQMDKKSNEDVMDRRLQNLQNPTPKETVVPAKAPDNYGDLQKMYMPIKDDPVKDKRLQQGTDKMIQNDSSAKTLIKPVVIDNSKTTGMTGGNKGNQVALDNSVDVRTDDPTLLKIQRQNTRYA